MKSQQSKFEIQIQRVQQEKFFYCAQACMKMFTNCNLSQDELWDKSRPMMKDSERWYTDPYALEETLEIITQFNINLLDFSNDYACVAKTLCHSLHNNQPTILVTRGGAHWVVMNGVARNNQNQITGVYVIDPGKGMAGASFVPFSKYFFEHFFSPVDVQGIWNGKRIALNLPLQIQDETAVVILDKMAGGSNTNGILDIDDLYQIVEHDFVSLGLGKANKILMGGSAVNPIKVMDISNSNTYQIIPIDNEKKICWAIINENNMRIEHVIFGEEFSIFSASEVETSLKDTLNRDDISVNPRAYWNSKCKDLYSKFDIIYQVSVGKHDFWVKATTKNIIPNFCYN